MQVIVTGCPRSGTRKLQAAFGYAKTLDSAHEQDADITISFQLAVDVDEYPSQHKPYWDREVDEIWHQVRNPLLCIPSLAEHIQAQYWVWQCKHTGLHPTAFRSRREFASYFWVKWNDKAQERHPCWRFRIEDLDEAWKVMWDRMGLTAPPIDPRSDEYKGRVIERRKPKPEPLTWEELRAWGPSIHDAVAKKYEEYGYA